MRRRAGQCWGLCSARCASHRPQQGRRCPSGRHARPPPGQAVQNARCSVPPTPPLLSEWGQGWPLFAPRKQCGRASSAPPEGSKSGHPAKGNEGERPPTGRGMPHRRTPRKAKTSRLRRALRGDLRRGKDGNKGARPLWPHTDNPPTTERRKHERIRRRHSPSQREDERKGLFKKRPTGNKANDKALQKQQEHPA